MGMGQFGLRSLIIATACIALSVGCYRAASPFMLAPAASVVASFSLYRAAMLRSRNGSPAEGLFLLASFALCLAMILWLVSLATPAIRT
jgi:hypothetical protein